MQRSLGRASSRDLLNGKSRATGDDGDGYRNGRESGYVHPDLQELSFGSLGAERYVLLYSRQLSVRQLSSARFYMHSGNLPPPMRPSAPGTRDEDAWKRGSLSDFSDYESSDEETHNHNSGSMSGSASGSHAYREYGSRSDDESETGRGALLDEDDPFADPEPEESEGEGVGTPGIPQRRLQRW